MVVKVLLNMSITCHAHSMSKQSTAVRQSANPATGRLMAAVGSSISMSVSE